MKKKQKLLTRISHYTSCPHCAIGDIEIDFEAREDLFLYPSYCNNCGSGYYLKLHKGEVELEGSGDTAKGALTFLKFNNMLLIVKDKVSEEDMDDQERHYSLRACPEEYFRAVVGVINLSNREADPHGLFEYITTVVIKEQDLMYFEKSQFSVEDFERITGLKFEELNT